jgi:hypothetical protein
MIFEDVATDIGIEHIAHQNNSRVSGGISFLSERKSVGTFEGCEKKSSQLSGLGRKIIESP